MNKAIRSALRLTFSPNAEWQAIRDDPPGPRGVIASFVLLLACIPAASLCLGLLLSGDARSIDLGWVAQRGAVAYFGTVLSILLLAASLFILAPLFAGGRNWARALQVAAYSSAPVLLAGLVLVVPALAYATLLAVVHSFYLQYVGVQRILGVKEGNAAEYVALGIVLLVVASTLLGAIGSRLGVL